MEQGDIIIKDLPCEMKMIRKTICADSKIRSESLYPKNDSRPSMMPIFDWFGNIAGFVTIENQPKFQWVLAAD